ncbi:MAG: hypothetical protein RL095_2003 [Verrucomicrobiota bacterium]
MKLARRIGFTALAGSLGIATLIGTMGYQQAHSAMMSQLEMNLQSLSVAKKESLHTYFDQLRGSLGFLSRSPATQKAFESLQPAFLSFPADLKPDKDLIAFYDEVTKDCLKNGAKQGVNLPEGRAVALQQQFLPPMKPDPNHPYAVAHESLHSFYTNVRYSLGLYDVFLISPDGDIIYTAAKEVDLGRNVLKDHELSQSGLAKVFKGAQAEAPKQLGLEDSENREILKDQIKVSDYQFYSPSKGLNAMFVAAPVHRDGKLVGVLAVQISDKRVSEILLDRSASIGNSGEVYAVGPDHMIRTNDGHFHKWVYEGNQSSGEEFSKEVPDEALRTRMKNLKTNVGFLEMKASYAGSQGELDIFANCIATGKEDHQRVTALGEDSLIAVSNFKMDGVNWAIAAEMGHDEAMADISVLRNRFILIGGLVGLASLIFSLWFGNRAAMPVVATAAAARDFASGNRRARGEVNTNDEIGALTRDMNVAFEAANSAELRASDIAAKANSSLEGAATPMMTCGADRIIDYVNPSAMKMMRENETLFTRELKNFNINRIVGSDVNIYHTQPEKQGRMLQDFSRMPINSFLKIGPKTFRVTITARRDTGGSYVGNTIEWLDVTEQLIAEKRAAGLSSAIENSGTAVMTCDANRVIDYCNPAVMKVLRDNEAVFRQYLPQFDITKVIGSCIDIFHKNPSHQARLLTDHSRLPLTAFISVGPKSFRLNLSAKKDQNGVYIGNTVEWLDITAQMASEKKAAQLSSVVEAVETNLMICDLNRKITYLNPAAQALMREHAAKFRSLFKSFDSEKLIGVCIDDFHANPSKQANLLGNPRNLPYKTEISAGGMEFGLVAMPLYDADGKYIGSGVQWLDNNARARYRNEVTGVIEAAKNGNLSHRGNVAAMDAVYKPMLAGINEVIDAVVAPIAEIREKLAKVSEGDLTAYVTGQYKGDHEVLKNSLNGTLDKLNEILLQVRDASSQMSQGASQVSSTSQMISQGATEQAASLEQITASMNEINSQTKGNAESAGRANGLAQAAQEDAMGGSQNMSRMVQAMSEIDESAQKISKIIKVIDEIAFQTNLLALNAAVEAARAGVHGKGFAVVAEEVRNLAARSANAAKETTELIEGSIKKVNAGSDVAQLTSQSLSKIVDGISKVSNLVGEIAAASNEQALGIGQVNQGLVQLDQVTQQNTANAEESAAASVELSEQASQLQELLRRFKLQAKGFSGGGMSGISPDLMDALRSAMAQQGMSLPALAPKPSTAKPAAPRSLPGGHGPASRQHNDIIPLD